MWLDERRLQPGDACDDEILTAIHRTVRLFVPIISANTEREEKGYIFREWRAAVVCVHDDASEPVLDSARNVHGYRHARRYSDPRWPTMSRDSCQLCREITHCPRYQCDVSGQRISLEPAIFRSSGAATLSLRTASPYGCVH